MLRIGAGFWTSMAFVFLLLSIQSDIKCIAAISINHAASKYLSFRLQFSSRQTVGNQIILNRGILVGSWQFLDFKYVFSHLHNWI